MHKYQWITARIARRRASVSWGVKSGSLTYINLFRFAGFSYNCPTFCMTLGPVALRKWLNQLKLAFHQECGSPTANLPHPGKVVTALAGCGLTGNQAGISPLDEGFFHGLVNHN